MYGSETLSHLARTRKIVFVEGMSDYKTIRRFAKNIGLNDLASGNDLTAFESGGFASWEKIKNFAWGVKNTIDSNMKLFAVYDRDYYCESQIKEILGSLKTELTYAHIHERKEMENYFLCIPVLERVLDKQITIKNKRSNGNIIKDKNITAYLEDITAPLKSTIQAQYVAKMIDYKKGAIDTSTISYSAIENFEKIWINLSSRITIVPGKVVLKKLRDDVQKDLGITLTDVQIIDEYKIDEIPSDLKYLIDQLEVFRKS